MYVTEPQAHDSIITQAASRANRGWLHPNLGNKPCSQLWISDYAAWLVTRMLREQARREEEREINTHTKMCHKIPSTFPDFFLRTDMLHSSTSRGIATVMTSLSTIRIFKS